MLTHHIIAIFPLLQDHHHSISMSYSSSSYSFSAKTSKVVEAKAAKAETSKVVEAKAAKAESSSVSMSMDESMSVEAKTAKARRNLAASDANVNKGEEAVVDMMERELQKKTKDPKTQEPTWYPTIFPTDFEESMSLSVGSLSASVSTKAGKVAKGASMSAEAKAAKGRRNLRVSDSAVNVPVAAPSVARELAAYERQLGTGVTATPTEFPPRPPSGVSLLSLLLNCI